MLFVLLKTCKLSKPFTQAPPPTASRRRRACMGSVAITPFFFFFFFLCALLYPGPTTCAPIAVPSVAPNFTASNFGSIDNSGAFLGSQNNSFQARISNPRPESQSYYYFVVVHVASNTIIWSANRNTPISKSGKLRLSSRGLSLYDDAGNPVWSTPNSPSVVSSLQILESGNLILLDSTNNTVWQSFDFPTDVIVAGQQLAIGKSLVSSLSDEDLSQGGYRFVVGDKDAMLQWNGISYWKMSTETNSLPDANTVAYMIMNSTGVYLIGEGGVGVLVEITLNETINTSSSSFRIAKLDPSGVFSVLKIDNTDGSVEQDFQAPDDKCRVPFVCGRCGVCSHGGSCQCAPGFHPDPWRNNGNCVPMDHALALPGPCNYSSLNKTVIKYLGLREDLDYFSNDFLDPVTNNASLSVCEGLCSKNCSCLGIFYSWSSSSCYMISDYMGSFHIKSTRDVNRLGFIKVIVEGNSIRDSSGRKNDFPIAEVLLPLSGVILIALIGILIWFQRKRRRDKRKNSKLARGFSSLSADGGDISFISIPGLPIRFDFKELALATEGFKTHIGSGGFGTVYKGTLHDGTDVAVKKITCTGSRGNREFLNEIAVIGKVHHVNLVKLKGFCQHHGQRFLVYEFMNRGSLDRSLFSGENVLEWKERYEIALGMARGLAYLHTGCEHKIIHCDVKPENILLNNNSQVKISDFGLSKLLSPEESGLFTTMRGTRGYLAPEWLTNSAISEKTDVYSYGMVLLEIVSGRKNSSVHQRPNNNNSSETDRSLTSSLGESDHQLVYFPLFALEMHKDRRYLDLVDERLMGMVRSEEAERLVRVALCCVQEDPNLRPSMSNVAGMLEGMMPLGEPRIESLNFLGFYGQRLTETSRAEDGNESVLYREEVPNSTSS